MTWLSDCACFLWRRGGAGSWTGGRNPDWVGGASDLSRGDWAGASARGSGATRGGALCEWALRESVLHRCACLAEVGSGEEVAPEVGLAWRLRVVRHLRPALLSRGRGVSRLSPPSLAAAMAKGRVTERSPTGTVHKNTVRDGTAGTRGPAVPGSGDHLNGE